MENEDNIKLKQSWWHIEDEIEPSDGRLVFRVQDFYIKKDHFEKDNSLDIPMGPYFVGFKVRNKSSGHELSFISDYSDENRAGIRVNLGSHSDWPPVPDTDYFHVKTQYEYIDFWPIFEKRAGILLGTRIPANMGDDKEFEVLWPKSKKNLIYLLFVPGYNGQFTMPGDSQGEISITVPLGMHIKAKGTKTEIIFYEGPVDKKTKQVKMSYREPHITDYNKKLKYHYIIDEKSYKHVIKVIKDNPGLATFFHIRYNVKNDIKFYLIFIFSLIFISLIMAIDWKNQNWFYFIIIFLSFLTLYITLRKEKYQIPFNNFILVTLMVSVPLLLFKPIITMFSDNVLQILMLLILISVTIGSYAKIKYYL